VRKELTAEIAKQKGDQEFTEIAEQFNNLVYEQSDSLKPAAERYKLKIRDAAAGSRARVGKKPAARASQAPGGAVFAGFDRQKRNTDAVEVAPGVLVAARMSSTSRSAAPFRAKSRPRSARKVSRARRLRAGAQGRAKQARSARQGRDAGLSWAARKRSRARSAGLPQATLRKSHDRRVAKLPAYAGADRGEDGYAIYRIGKVIPARQKPSSRRRRCRHASTSRRAQSSWMPTS
jgi:peptidyl-prolyl cis-trans isomerase D